MKQKTWIFLVFLITIQVHSQNEIFQNLLQKHVNENGFVDYQSFKKDLPQLKKYTDYLATTTSSDSWSVNKQKAFWINAYNAYTILLILENYPIKSITDINIDGNSAWKIPFAKVGNIDYTLDFIEHEILRKKLFDPSIHVGVNCASISCPKLSNNAFTEDNIEASLESLMSEFVNDSSKNKISNNTIEISAIFGWFTSDFTKTTSLIDYLNRFSKIKISSDASVIYQNYDWNLNKQ